MEITLRKNRYYRGSFSVVVNNTKNRMVLKVGSIFFDKNMDSHVFRVDFDLLFLLLLNGAKIGDQFFKNISLIRGELFLWVFLLVLLGKK